MSSGRGVKDLKTSVALRQKEWVRDTKECANFFLLLPFPLNSIVSFKLHFEVADNVLVFLVYRNERLSVAMYYSNKHKW